MRCCSSHWLRLGWQSGSKEDEEILREAARLLAQAMKKGWPNGQEREDILAQLTPIAREALLDEEHRIQV